MKLSIVIPVYQVAQTLPRCLDSIISQSFRDWQAILIDDCSTDGSSKLCDQYVKRDHRFQVIHLKRNEGLSIARNKGLEKAKGQYITFVDSDDYIGEDTWKTLFEILTTHPDYDLLEYPAYEHYGSKHTHLLRLPRREYTDPLAYWLEGEAYMHTYAWNKIYRREVLQGVKFPEKRTFEDVYTLPQIIKNCNVIATTDVGIYYYCYNPEGITQKASGRDLGNLLYAHTKMLNYISSTLKRRRRSRDLEKHMPRYYAQVLNIQLDVFRTSGKLSKKFPLLPYRHTFKLKLLHLLGLKRLCQLHKLFHRNR